MISSSTIAAAARVVAYAARRPIALNLSVMPTPPLSEEPGCPAVVPDRMPTIQDAGSADGVCGSDEHSLVHSS